jgi:hypothetical protein
MRLFGEWLFPFQYLFYRPGYLAVIDLYSF